MKMKLNDRGSLDCRSAFSLLYEGDIASKHRRGTLDLPSASSITHQQYVSYRQLTA